jgi:hypothetical protein
MYDREIFREFLGTDVNGLGRIDRIRFEKLIVKSQTYTLDNGIEFMKCEFEDITKRWWRGAGEQAQINWDRYIEV